MCKLKTALILILGIAMVGCAANDVKVLKKNDIMETKQITSEVSCSYEVSGDKYSEWFNLDVDTLLTDLNNIAAQKEYPALWKLYPDGPYGKGMLTRDGESWFVLAKLHDDCFVKKIQLSLYSDGSEEQQKANGDYIYFLINLFTPNMAEKVTDELKIFEADQRSMPSVRQIICGNTIYRFEYDESLSSDFYVIPARDPKFDQSGSPKSFAIKPD